MGTMWYYRPILTIYIGFVLMTIKRIYPILSNYLKTDTCTFRTRFTWTYNKQDGRTRSKRLHKKDAYRLCYKLRKTFIFNTNLLWLKIVQWKFNVGGQIKATENSSVNQNFKQFFFFGRHFRTKYWYLCFNVPFESLKAYFSKNNYEKLKNTHLFLSF